MANESLATGRVIGDVLDPFNSTVDLTVLYNGRPIVSGMEFRSPAVSDKPRVEIGGDDIRVAYTLVMVDPDAPNPSNPTLREYLHCQNGKFSYGYASCPGKRASMEDFYETRIDCVDGQIVGLFGVFDGRELMCYESPNPATGIHRLVLVLFRQLGRETVFAPSMRHNFNTRSFARRYNLGAPVAAMYFNCQRQAGSGGRRFTGPYTSRRQQA